MGDQSGGGRRTCARGNLAGTPARIADNIGTYARAGAETIYLQVLDLSDLEHLELFAADVMPQVWRRPDRAIALSGSEGYAS